MPGQEKMVLDYYQKNPTAAQGLKGALYEDKILSLFKSKIKLIKKDISTSGAEKIISDFNKSSQSLLNNDHSHDDNTDVKKENKVSETSPLPKKKKQKKLAKSNLRLYKFTHESY